MATTKQLNGNGAVSESENKKADLVASGNNLRALIEKTDKENPDPKALAELRRKLNDWPEIVNKNDPAHHAIGKMIESYSKSGAMRAMLEELVHLRRTEFAYDVAGPIERMLIDQIILCSIRTNHMESVVAEKLLANQSFESGMYFEKRLTLSQRRFMLACESWAKVRKLLAEAEHYEQKARNARGKIVETALTA